MVLAGGEGKRLMPLTTDRAKPAVPFGGSYRLVDFVLSNIVNAGFHRICVLTQYKSHSLDRHLATSWQVSSLLGDFVASVPAQQRLGPRWYTGSADAILQSLNLVYDAAPEYILVFGADHVYRMDPEQMLEAHIVSGAGVTVAGIRVPRAEASAFGVMETGADGVQISRFLEKPDNPPAIPGSPDEAFASMGNYIFTTEVLINALLEDAHDENSIHDMGTNIIPNLTKAGQAAVYDFGTNEVPGATPRDRGYWRDVGTIESYYEAHMDLVSVHPVFNLYNQKWPILTSLPPLAPAKFVNGGSAGESVVGAGTVISGARVEGSVIAHGVRIDDGAMVTNSVVMPGVHIGRGAVVSNAILDKNASVPEGALLGVDLDADRSRYTVTDAGIVVLGKGVRAL